MFIIFTTFSITHYFSHSFSQYFSHSFSQYFSHSFSLFLSGRPYLSGPHNMTLIIWPDQTVCGLMTIRGVNEAPARCMAPHLLGCRFSFWLPSSLVLNRRHLDVLKGFQFLVARCFFQVPVPVCSFLTETPFRKVFYQLTAQEGVRQSTHHKHLKIKAYLTQKRRYVLWISQWTFFLDIFSNLFFN